MSEISVYKWEDMQKNFPSQRVAEIRVPLQKIGLFKKPVKTTTNGVFLPNARKRKISNRFYKYHIIVIDFRHRLTQLKFLSSVKIDMS